MLAKPPPKLSLGTPSRASTLPQNRGRFVLQWIHQPLEAYTIPAVAQRRAGISDGAALQTTKTPDNRPAVSGVTVESDAAWPDEQCEFLTVLRGPYIREEFPEESAENAQHQAKNQ